MATHAVEDPSGVGSRHQPEATAIRPNALHEANRLHSAFFGSPLQEPPPSSTNDANPTSSSKASSTKTKKSKNERLCMGGHRETIFGLSFSHDGKYLATASQDSTICIWDVASHKLVATLNEGMDVKYECLRVAWMRPREGKSGEDANGGEKYLLASAGADGIARLWSATQSDSGKGKLKWQCVGTLDHYKLEEKDQNEGGDNMSVEVEDQSEKKDEEKEEEEDRPQIYALQFVRSSAAPDMNLLLTSANDIVYLWNIVEDEDDNKQSSEDGVKRKKFLHHLSMRFSHLDDERSVNKFGGERNPNNELYVFDASYSETNDYLGVALSDGTCRVLPLARDCNDSICQEQCVLSLPPGYFPGRGGHLTGLSWDKSGTRLATCIASGRVVLWLLQVVDRNGTGVLHPSCISVLEGGHDVGRPLFGVKYCGGNREDLLVTWGVDGKVCMWDSYSVGEVNSPLCTLISHSNYPIYALDITDDSGTSKAKADEKQKLHMAVGGGADGGFLGVPVYIYDI